MLIAQVIVVKKLSDRSVWSAPQTGAAQTVAAPWHGKVTTPAVPSANSGGKRGLHTPTVWKWPPRTSPTLFAWGEPPLSSNCLKKKTCQSDSSTLNLGGRGGCEKLMLLLKSVGGVGGQRCFNSTHGHLFQKQNICIDTQPTHTRKRTCTRIRERERERERQ